MKILFHKYLIIIGLVLVSLSSLAQSEDYFTITGTVIDEKAKVLMENASIGISNRSMGTISNSVGRFLLKIPVKFSKDSLIVSYLGYARYACVIDEVIDNKNLVIHLTPSSILLNEVTVQETAFNAEYIIAKAIEKIKDNYPTNPFLLEGFFRGILKEDSRYVQLTEAAIRVFDKHFQRRLKRAITEDVQIIEARKSLNYANPLIQQVRKQNEIVDLLDQNPIHYQRGFLNAKFFNYKIDSVFQSEKDLIYIISTIPGDHKIYVMDGSFAILKTIEQVKVGNSYKRLEFPLNDSLIVRRMVYLKSVSEFKEYNGKMFLKYLNETDAYEILNKRNRKREFLIESYKEFVVTNIIDRDVTPFTKKESYNFKDGIVGKDYNPVFWDNYSTIQLSPLKPAVKKDLEAELSLSGQFRKSE